tara:strand:+ start:464 stop:601 length:138 start_codon:yes stop_codon:yes gene_type:complete
MEEKWKTHPTSEKIFINQDDGLMYEKLSSGRSDKQPSQKMAQFYE